jgi:hypothetical protein
VYVQVYVFQDPPPLKKKKEGGGVMMLVLFHPDLHDGTTGMMTTTTTMSPFFGGILGSPSLALLHLPAQISIMPNDKGRTLCNLPVELISDFFHLI